MYCFLSPTNLIILLLHLSHTIVSLYLLTYYSSTLFISSHYLTYLPSPKTLPLLLYSYLFIYYSFFYIYILHITYSYFNPEIRNNTTCIVTNTLQKCAYHTDFFIINIVLLFSLLSWNVANRNVSVPQSGNQNSLRSLLAGPAWLPDWVKKVVSIITFFSSTRLSWHPISAPCSVLTGPNHLIDLCWSNFLFLIYSWWKFR